MNNSFPMVPLGEILTKAEEWTDIKPDERYRQITVRLWGKGVILRDEVSGGDIAAARRNVVRSQQFILSRIDARNGAFGLIPDSLDGAVVSSDFPVFILNRAKVLPEFLNWISKTHDFVDICRASSEGTTNRVRLKEERFLAAKIPLPSLSEQSRIVARIEELAARIEEARGLRRETVGEAEKLLAGAEFRVWTDESLEESPCLEEVTTFLSRGRHSAQGDSKHYLIKTQHVQQGNYVRSQITLAPEVAVRVSPDAIVKQGDVLLACSAAGCLGRVACFMEADQLASTDTHIAIARANPEIILPEYLYVYLRGAQGQVQLRSRERGDWMREKVGFRLTELNLADLKSVPVPLPPLTEQRHIVAYLDDLQSKVDSLKQLQSETSAELDALLPSILDKAFKGEL